LRRSLSRPALLLVAALVSLQALAYAASGPKIERTRRYARDHLIVKYKKRTPKGSMKALRTRIKARRLRKFRYSGSVLLKLDAGEDVDAVIDRVRADPNVEYVRRDHYLRIHQTFPDDTDFESCWGLHNTNQYLLGKEDADIDAPEAWDITTGSSSVIVAVIDTGVEYDHEDLADNMWVNQAEANGTPGVDDDNNGYTDDIHGISVINGVATGDPYDDHGHGTHCAGILGAVGNNGTGITGVNWNMRIMALKFLDASGYGLESDAAVCLQYAVDNGAKITSNSYGGASDVQELYDAIVYANDNGVLFCTSAGNDSQDLDQLPSYPASYNLPNMISVAATGYGDNIAWFSNYGATTVHVGAPGEVITSTWAGNTYKDLDGTSMACPFVAGIAALVKAYEPAIDMPTLRARVMWTGDPLFDLQETTVTGLRVNAYNALMGIFSVRILSQSPLPDATENEAYNFTMEAVGFAPPYEWSWSGSDYVEREVANGFTWSGAAQNRQQDEGMWRLDLPISFPFYGATYDRLYVCSNGYVEFADSMPLPDNNAETGRLANKKIIAPYWSDLTTNSTSLPTNIYVWRAPDDSWIGVRWQASELDWLMPMAINVSLVLHADGLVEMHYGPDNSSWVGGVVGISNGDGVNYRLSYHKTGKFEFGWALTSQWGPGQIPPGLSLDPDTGEIGGAPTAPGDYTFDVTAADQSGGSDTKLFDLKVFDQDGPRANFHTDDPREGVSSVTVTFQDDSTSIAPGGIASRLWNFGDGSTSADLQPTHTYNGVGSYSVSLTVTDANGTDAKLEIGYIKVYYPGPTAAFAADPLVGDAPLTVRFTDYSQPLDPNDLFRMLVSWEWDFGDGTVETRYDSTPFDHVYQDEGLYTVRLTVLDLLGAAGVETKPDYIAVGAVRDRTLTWSVTGSGAITVDPPGVTSASGAEIYDHGSVVDLTANPDPGNHFDHWEGDVDDPRELSTSIYMGSDQTVVAVFGAGDPGEIGGAKWEDLDGDGVWDGDEDGLQGWRIYLDLNGSGAWDADEPYRMTDGNGDYVFANLPPGTYTVAEELLSGWEQTFPGSPTYSHTVPLGSGETIGNIRFGNRFVGTPPPAPINPTPAHGATGVAGDTGLSWESGASSDGYVEDFNDGSAQGWLPRDAANWQVVGGEYRADAGQTYVRMQSSYVGQTWTDCAARMTTRRNGDSLAAAVLALRCTDDFQWLVAGRAYIVGIDGGGKYHVARQIGDAYFMLQDWTTGAGLNPGGAPNVVKMVIEGSSISVYFNGSLAWSGSDSQIAQAGRITLCGQSGGATEAVHYFDDVSVADGAGAQAQGGVISPLQRWYNANPIPDGAGDYAPPDARGASSSGLRATGVSDAAAGETYDVYFGTDPTPTNLIAQDLAELTCDPTPGGGSLDAGTTYYWRVVARNDAGQTPGAIWSFTTGGITYALQVQSTLISGVQIAGSHPGDTNYAVVVNDGEAVSLTAPATVLVGSNTYEFVKWVVNDAPGPDGTLTVAFNATQDTTAVAEFSLEVMVDNGDAQSDRYFQVLSGDWGSSGGLSPASGAQAAGDPDPGYLWAPATAGAETARSEWVCTDLPGGNYEVLAWWPTLAEALGQNVAYEVHHAGGVTTVRVNQDINGGQWNSLGVFTFEAGSHIVQIHNGQSAPGDYIVADAVKFDLLGSADENALVVTLEPEGAQAAARWRVDGGAWRASGETETGLFVGSHTVEFSAIEGWVAPASEQTQIAAGQTTEVTASYQRKGDFDDDGDCDFWDFMIFTDVYGLTDADPDWLPDGPVGDFDDDGNCDFWDFMAFVDVYGT